MPHKNSYPLKEVLAGLDVTVRGDDGILVYGVATLKSAEAGQVSFLTNSVYRRDLGNTAASAVLLREEDASRCLTTAVICKNPHYIYAKVSQFFDQRNQKPVAAGIHPTAVIAEDAIIPESCTIAAGVVIESGVVLGEHVVIGAQCFVGEGVKMGAGSVLHPRVTIYHAVEIGDRVCIASGAVIGSDGFGFAIEKREWHKVVQFGSVIIGDDVDIGANTTIDRGAIEHTVIEKGVKLDNQIQIAHNVRIGEGTIIAGCTGIAGSTTIGKHCMIGGSAKFAGHLEIVDHVVIYGCALIHSSILKPGVYSSGMVGVLENKEWRRMCARVLRLSDLYDRVKKIEKLTSPSPQHDSEKTEEFIPDE